MTLIAEYVDDGLVSRLEAHDRRAEKGEEVILSIVRRVRDYLVHRAYLYEELDASLLDPRRHISVGHVDLISSDMIFFATDIDNIMHGAHLVDRGTEEDLSKSAMLRVKKLMEIRLYDRCGENGEAAIKGGELHDHDASTISDLIGLADKLYGRKAREHTIFPECAINQELAQEVAIEASTKLSEAP